MNVPVGGTMAMSNGMAVNLLGSSTVARVLYASKPTTSGERKVGRMAREVSKWICAIAGKALGGEMEVAGVENVVKSSFP